MTEPIIEELDIIERKTPNIFLANTIGQHLHQQKDIFSHFHIDRSGDGPKTMKVEMTINGVPVSFSDTVNQIWASMSNSFNQRVEERAMDLTAGYGHRFDDIIVEAENKLQKALLKELNRIIKEK
jgi:hypothetical protein